MNSKAAPLYHKPQLKTPRGSRMVITRFIARHSIRSAAFIALAFAVFVATKVIGYADLYPTTQDRLTAASLFNNNLGLTALFGAPYHLDTIAGYAAWYAITMGVLLGSIWAFLVATRVFRGDETAGRWELLLTGPTTARRAVISTLAGLGASLALFYVIATFALVAIGSAHNIEFSLRSCAYLALVSVSSAALFVTIGAFTSQLTPTRGQAVGFAMLIFGVFFLLRSTGDVTSMHWLLNITPFGWLEKTQPFFNPQPLWLLPMAGATLLFATAAVYLAGRRDLYGSFFKDKVTSKPHLRFMNSPFMASIRLTRASTVSWVLGIIAYTMFFGALTSIAAQAFASSTEAQQYLMRLANTAQETGAKVFLSVGFMLFILGVMAYAAYAVGAMRADESQGYLDNFLVRPFRRQRWLRERISYIIITMLIIGLLAPIGTWLSMNGDHYSISLNDLFQASINGIVPAFFILGAGIFTLGFLPRLTTIVSYGIIAWSFIIQMISSGLKIDQWILDTSILSHVSLAPATTPDWNTDLVILGVGALLMLLGAYRFNFRDLVAE